MVLDPRTRHDVSPDAVCRLCEVFPQLQLNSEEVKEEFLDFQLLDDDELPRKKELDKFWGSLRKKRSSWQTFF